MNKHQAEQWVATRKLTDREYELLDEVVHGKVLYIDGVLHRQPRISAVPWPCVQSDRYMLSRLLSRDLIQLTPQSRHDSTPVYRATNDGLLYHSLYRALDSKTTARP